MQSPESPTIVSLTYVKRRAAGEMRLELSDGRILTLDPDIAVRHGLARGMALGADSEAEVMAEQDLLTARRRLVGYLSARRKTEVEARRYLRGLGYEGIAADAAMDSARALGYLDDGAYAEAFARGQTRAKRGPRAIRHEMLARGVAKETVEAAVTHLSGRDEQTVLARSAAARRAGVIAANEPDARAARAKLTAFLARRGFDLEVCTEVAKDLLAAHALGGLDDDDDGAGDE